MARSTVVSYAYNVSCEVEQEIRGKFERKKSISQISHVWLQS